VEEKPNKALLWFFLAAVAVGFFGNLLFPSRGST
jgi:hypothetical protein